MGSMEKQQLLFFIFLALNLFILFSISEHVAPVELKHKKYFLNLEFYGD